ncbi:hypothetical protein RUM43_006696 [Polyplax serrata]|uniref:Uncharacterized protein n=1 Tax=Polyplax serrata TaxID=468196 RepID=A0AAN8PLR4_POLSC
MTGVKTSLNSIEFCRNDEKTKLHNKRENDGDLRKLFPNFAALSDDERLAFFEALSSARRNVEKSGAEARQFFGTVHDEYLQVFESGSRQRTKEMSVKPSSASSSSTQATYILSSLLKEAEENTSMKSLISNPEDCNTDDLSLMRKTSNVEFSKLYMTANGVPKKKKTKDSDHWEGFALNEKASSEANRVKAWTECESEIFLAKDRNIIVDLYLKKKRLEKEKLNSDVKKCEEQSLESSRSLRERDGVASLAHRNQAIVKSLPKENINPEENYGKEGFEVQGGTPKFDALNSEEREIFFKILKEAHDNVHQRNPQNEIIPLNTILERYETDRKAPDGTSVRYENARRASPQEECKYLKVKMKLTSVDNERLKKEAERRLLELENKEESIKEESREHLHEIRHPKLNRISQGSNIYIENTFDKGGDGVTAKTTTDVSTKNDEVKKSTGFLKQRTRETFIEEKQTENEHVMSRGKESRGNPTPPEDSKEAHDVIVKSEHWIAQVEKNSENCESGQHSPRPHKGAASSWKSNESNEATENANESYKVNEIISKEAEAKKNMIDKNSETKQKKSERLRRYSKLPRRQNQAEISKTKVQKASDLPSLLPAAPRNQIDEHRHSKNEMQGSNGTLKGESKPNKRKTAVDERGKQLCSSKRSVGVCPELEDNRLNKNVSSLHSQYDQSTLHEGDCDNEDGGVKEKNAENLSLITQGGNCEADICTRYNEGPNPLNYNYKTEGNETSEKLKVNEEKYVLDTRMETKVLENDDRREKKIISVSTAGFFPKKVVLMDDSVIEKVKQLIEDLEIKAKKNSNPLANEYVYLLLNYIDYLSKVLHYMIEVRDERITQLRPQVRSSLTSPNIYVKFQETAVPTSSGRAHLTEANVPRSVSNSGITRSEPVGKDEKHGSPKGKGSSPSLSTASLGSANTSEADEDNLMVPMFVKKKRLPTTKIRVLQDLLKEKAVFVEGSISDFKIVQLPGEEESTNMPTGMLHIEEEEDARSEKGAKFSCLKVLTKLCRCGKKESTDDDDLLENLKGEAVAVDVTRGTKTPASVTLNESTMEVLKAAQRKKVIQKYWKTG